MSDLDFDLWIEMPRRVAFPAGMDERERREFRMNPQAMVILLITMLAMALPLAGMVLFASGYLKRPEPAEAETAAPVARDSSVEDALRASLEKVADSTLAAKPLKTQSTVVELPVNEEELVVQSARIEALAKMAGGSSLRMTDADGALLRMGVSVPASRAELFRRAARSERVDFSSAPASDETAFVEIRFVHASGGL